VFPFFIVLKIDLISMM